MVYNKAAAGTSAAVGMAVAGDMSGVLRSVDDLEPRRSVDDLGPQRSAGVYPIRGVEARHSVLDSAGRYSVVGYREPSFGPGPVVDQDCRTGGS